MTKLSRQARKYIMWDRIQVRFLFGMSIIIMQIGLIENDWMVMGPGILLLVFTSYAMARDLDKIEK